MNAKLVTQDSQLNYAKSWRKPEEPSNTHYSGHIEMCLKTFVLTT
jgi:hypothetical protein